MSFPIKSLVFVTALILFLAADAKITHVEFYFHETLTGPNASLVTVARRSNYTGTNPILASFGTINIFDIPLRETTSTNGTIIGRAQGLEALSSQEELSLSVSITYVFIAGEYNGSSFSVLGRSPILDEVREFPIVGGTGKFRLARGYCLVRTYSSSDTYVIVGHNATLILHH